MEEAADWALEFYTDERGSSPVEEFLDTLDVKTRTRFRWSMEQVWVRNVQARAPLVRHLEGDLCENPRTPRQELDIGRRRYQDFLARKGRRR